MTEDTPTRAARDLLDERRRAYRRTFGQRKGARGWAVLLDLARYCRAHRSTFDPDPIKAATLNGRREVWLRIQNHLRLDEDALWALYDGRPLK